jgi:hypothetical protein
MSGGFIARPDASPAAIASGGRVEVTLHYKHQRDRPDDPDPEVQVACSPTFEITCDPARATLPPADNGTKRLAITIKRIAHQQSPDECTLRFTALDDEREVAVEVKR